MTDRPSSAVVGIWARDKLDALGEYLNYYTTALKKQIHWKLVFIDAFAGGGKAMVKTASAPAAGPLLLEEGQVDAEQFELIKGSPRVALDVTNPFNKYVFIDPDKARVRELNELKAEYQGRRSIEVREGTAQDEIAAVLATGVSRRTHRGVAFLDPFGANLSWDTVEALASTEAFEVLINFGLNMAIQRMLPNNARFQPGWRDRLDAYFGTSRWYDEVYEETNDLLGSKLAKRADYHLRLLEMYRLRLKQAFGHVSSARLIKNTRGIPLYYLIWAGPHPLGLKGADHILKKGEAQVRRR
jgi:three-Cys-motif partner protein